MTNDRNDMNSKSHPHDQENKLPKDVLNNEQDPDSFRDPLEVELEREANMRKAHNEEVLRQNTQNNNNNNMGS